MQKTISHIIYMTMYDVFVPAVIRANIILYITWIAGIRWEFIASTSIVGKLCDITLWVVRYHETVYVLIGIDVTFSRYYQWQFGCLCGLVGSVLDHRSLPPEFESQRGHIWRLFHLRLRFITFGGRSVHLAYLVHKSGRKTSIIIITNNNLVCVVLIIFS